MPAYLCVFNGSRRNCVKKNFLFFLVLLNPPRSHFRSALRSPVPGECGHVVGSRPTFTLLKPAWENLTWSSLEENPTRVIENSLNVDTEDDEAVIIGSSHLVNYEKGFEHSKPFSVMISWKCLLIKTI